MERWLEQMTDAADTLLNQTRQALPDVDRIPATPLETDGPGGDPLITERQKDLHSYYDLFGVIGLWHYIREIAIHERDLEAEHGSGAGRKRKRPRRPDDLGGHISWDRLI